MFFRNLMIYAPLGEQPKENLLREEMTEVCSQHILKLNDSFISYDLKVWNHVNLFLCSFWQREQIIFDHFSDPVFINQFVEFLSLEDRKGKDKFSPRRFCLFKVRFLDSSFNRRSEKQKVIHLLLLIQGLFRNFSDAFLPLLRPHMERLVVDTHESKQRCVAEIISGLIRGCKHWSYLKVQICSMGLCLGN